MVYSIHMQEEQSQLLSLTLNCARCFCMFQVCITHLPVSLYNPMYTTHTSNRSTHLRSFTMVYYVLRERQLLFLFLTLVYAYFFQSPLPIIQAQHRKYVKQQQFCLFVSLIWISACGEFTHVHTVCSSVLLLLLLLVVCEKECISRWQPYKCYYKWHACLPTWCVL